MKWNRRILFILLTVVALLLISYLLSTQDVEENAPLDSASEIVSLEKENVPVESSSEEVESPNVSGKSEELSSQQEKFLEAFNTPIKFYGKVVDESGSPIEDADVEYSANNRPWKGGAKGNIKSNSQGLFQISNRGIALSVSVTKDGYYSTLDSKGGFKYSNPGRSSPKLPSKSEPAVFVLHKKGEAEPLVKFKRVIRIPKDGTPTEISLRSRKKATNSSSDLVVESWTDNEDIPLNQYVPYPWKCRLSVPGGGLIVREDEHSFEAPLEGYKEEFVYDMRDQGGDVKWKDNFKEEFFVKLSDGNFARMTFQFRSGGDHFLVLNAYFNPSGSRNLEFDPSKQINQ